MQQICKPGSVPCKNIFRRRSKISTACLSFICETTSPLLFSNLPLGIGRATLFYPIYMVLQPIMRTAYCIAAISGELLPRLFTLTSFFKKRRSGYFLLRSSALANSFLLGSMVLCVARTFLIPYHTESDKPICCNYKINIYPTISGKIIRILIKPSTIRYFN